MPDVLKKEDFEKKAEMKSELNAPKLTDWKNEPSVADLKQDLTDSQSDHSNQTSKINKWLDYLHVRGEGKAKTKEGRSSVTPKLIRKQAEWRYASLSEPFLSTPDLFNIDPVSHEDKEAAKQNALLLNNQFNTKLNKVSFINDYVRTTVNEGTAIIKVGWEYEEEEYTVEEMQYDYVESNDEATLALMQQIAGLEQEYPDHYHNELDDHLRIAYETSLELGTPVRPVERGIEEVDKVRIIKNQPTLEICDYEDTFVDPTCRGDSQKAGFIVHRFETAMSELKKDERYTNLDSIRPSDHTILGEPDSYGSEDFPNRTSFNFQDEPRKRIMAYEYWGNWDIDGDGTVVPIVATFVGQTMIRLEENPFPDRGLPFVTVPYLPVKNSVYGEPDGELLIDNQKISGAVTRGMIDLLGRSANGQTGHRKDALDTANRRKFIRGDDYEFNPNVDPSQAIYQHTFPEIPQSAQFMLGLQNNEAEALTGVKAFSQGISGQALGTTATGVRSALDATAKRDLDILRRLTAGIEKIGRKIIAMNAEFLDEKEVVRITNEEFVTVRRDDLPGHFDLRLSISTAEADNQKAEELAFMLQTLGPNVSFEFTKVILADIARLRKMPSLAKKIEDYQQEPDPIQQEIAQLEVVKLKAEIAKIESETMNKGTGAQLNQARAGTEQARADNLRSETDLNTLDFVEQESGTKHARELQNQQAQAEGNAKLELVKSALMNANQNQQTNQNQ